jgi:membrane protease YdiL (CAAX protease family)
MRRPRALPAPKATEMSLRSFHLLFIGLAVILAAFFAAWAGGQYRLEHEALYAVTSALSLLTGAGLAWYGAAFQRKTRHL